MLIIELLIASVMLLLTVLLHGVGLSLLPTIAGLFESGEAERPWIARYGASAWHASILVLGILALTIIEVWLYAGLYVAIGAISPFREALYYSTISFAAIGYTDVAISQDWKLLGAIEGINGNLLLGWSVAFLVMQIRRVGRSRPTAPKARPLPEK